MPTRPALLAAALLAPLLIAACGPRDPDGLARQVTIRRDAWGVPHVHGRTDAATVFGFAYAQAEDHFRQLEDNFIRASGRLAEVAGESGVASDLLNRALAIPALARAEYAALDADMRALVDAYAAGVNWYLARHPEVRPRLLATIEPWHTLAFIRYNYYQQGFALREMRRAGLVALPPPVAAQRDGQGSNGWAIAPARSASGHALLFINPHLPWFGPGQVYEGHLVSDAGWHFTGYTRFGFPFPYVGHNEDLGWVSTDNAADQADLYLETFDHPTDSLSYRYGDGWRQAVAWTDTIVVRRADSTLESRTVALRRTHHGPIVGSLGGRPVAVRMARFEESGWLREWYDMTRARSLAEFQAAMRPLAMQFGNAMYADRAGNTWYVYNGAVPRRDPAFDWAAPVEGRDPRTEWQGYHTLEELPQLLNPADGWMQNCNGTPFLLTGSGNPDSAAYPRYMVGEGDNARSARSRSILAARTGWTLEALATAAFDTHVHAAEVQLPGLLAQVAAARLSPEAAAAREVLREWNLRADTGEVGMTLFARWREQLDRGVAAPAALAAVVDSLTRQFGTWRVSWGTATRVQRPDVLAGERFSDARASLPLPGAPSILGAVMTIWPTATDSGGRRYATGGGSYISVVEFGPEVRARTVHALGASGDPRSPHYTDQAALHAARQFRDALFTDEAVRRGAVRTYRPGRE